MTLGETFRQLRLARHLTLKQVADPACSFSFISKFERGERAIGFERLVHLLDRINVTVVEFMQAWQPMIMPPSPEFSALKAMATPYSTTLLRLNHAIAKSSAQNHQITTKEIAALARLEEESLQADGGTARWQRCLRIARQVGVVIVENNRADPGLDDDKLFAQLAQLVQPVVAYLFTVETWGIFELAMLRVFAAAIDVETNFRLAKLAVARVTSLQVPQLQDLLMVVLQGSISKCINNQQWQQAQQLLTWRREQTPEDGVRWALESTFLEGWLRLAQGDHKGLDQCRAVISMLKTLQLHAWASVWQQRLDAIIHASQDPLNWSVYL